LANGKTVADRFDFSVLTKSKAAEELLDGLELAVAAAS